MDMNELHGTSPKMANIWNIARQRAQEAGVDLKNAQMIDVLRAASKAPEFATDDGIAALEAAGQQAGISPEQIWGEPDQGYDPMHTPGAEGDIQAMEMDGPEEFEAPMRQSGMRR